MTETDERIPAFLDRMAAMKKADGGLSSITIEDANRLLDIAQRFFRLDKEAATHVESVICLRTHFTGDPPYVGWKGLGLALGETLDERDRFREALRVVARWATEQSGAAELMAKLAQMALDAHSPQKATVQPRNLEGPLGWLGWS